MRREARWMAVLAAGLIAVPAHAQFPGEISGRITEAGTGAALEAAAVELPAAGRAARTDASGAFRIRGVEAGRHRVLVRRAGAAGVDTVVVVRDGTVTRLDVALAPAPYALAAVTVAARAAEGARMDRGDIRASGARTAGDVLARMPGVVVRGTGAASEQTVSIRGSAPGAVLVLLDGAPLNDPVTGTADLSAVPAHAVERVTVLPGAQTSRYGPRAQAGVVLIETRRASARHEAALGAGTLGERAGEAEAGFAGGGVAASGGMRARRIGGAFDHPRDANDPTVVRRENADLAEASVFGTVAAPLGGGELRLRGGAETMDRGIPGRAYAPSPAARQSMDRLRGAAAWRRSGIGGSAAVSVTAVGQATHHRDPAPPAGLPYDARTAVRTLHARMEAERRTAGALRWGGGAESAVQRVDAGALRDDAPALRRDGGAWVHGGTAAALGGVDLDLSVQARMDRDGLSGGWHPTHAVSIGAARAGVRLGLAHRSAFSPPTLGDQFFREGVAVAPNPDLRPERVRGEWELSAAAGARVVGADASLAAAAYRADVQGMIVWSPDFRFVWSPRNTDVRRRGVDLRGTLDWPGLRLRGDYALAAVTYTAPGLERVQLVYRPRHTGQVRGEWRGGGWRAEAGARYVGTRNPTPSTINALPGFWTADVVGGREWRAGGYVVSTTVGVDRLFGERAALIYGYPEPGRRVRLELRAGRAERAFTSGTRER
jgi:vitamin B12 transporter